MTFFGQVRVVDNLQLAENVTTFVFGLFRAFSPTSSVTHVVLGGGYHFGRMFPLLIQPTATTTATAQYRTVVSLLMSSPCPDVLTWSLNVLTWSLNVLTLS